MQKEINSYQNITELIGKTPLVRLKISDLFVYFDSCVT